MPDEYALLRWETEGGASDESEPLQEQATVEQEEAVRVNRAERLGPPTRHPPAAPGGARRLTVRFG